MKPCLLYTSSSLENQVQLSIYLKDGLTTEQIMSVGKQIKAIPNLKKLEFVNKEQAMKEFKAVSYTHLDVYKRQG